MISLAFYRIDWKSQQHRPVQPPCPSAARDDNFRHPLEMAGSARAIGRRAAVPRLTGKRPYPRACRRQARARQRIVFDAIDQTVALLAQLDLVAITQVSVQLHAGGARLLEALLECLAQHFLDAAIKGIPFLDGFRQKFEPVSRRTLGCVRFGQYPPRWRCPCVPGAGAPAQPDAGRTILRPRLRRVWG